MASRWFLLAILTASYGAGAFGVLGISPLSPSLVAAIGWSVVNPALGRAIVDLFPIHEQVRARARARARSAPAARAGDDSGG